MQCKRCLSASSRELGRVCLNPGADWASTLLQLSEGFVCVCVPRVNAVPISERGLAWTRTFLV